MLTSMSRLPLNVLPLFRVVADLQNLRAAALQLHLTHSAVSQQIRTLETQLGFALFDRRARRLVLNPAGQALLRATEPALALLDEGVQAAAAAAAGSGLRLRISVLPSLAQLWLLPRMARWHAHHPDIALEIETSQQVVDLHREGFHAALRFGRGPWAGQQSEPLFDTPTRMILVAAPATARRLAGADPQRLAHEPLLGEQGLWQAWFQAAGVRATIKPVALFNDAGMLAQAAEQNLGLALVRELLAADALAAGRLVRLSPLAIAAEQRQTFHLVYRPELSDWPPLQALRQWLHDELALARATLAHEAGTPPRRRRARPAA
ncbi:LysR substrate-binding domain-containing protein [Bordetella bronchiseptica]|uniref:LysR substrate-binding domain-containing protein n=1 Tax=Bordetella bronchiseptica TaxID=518 RepID=UPI000528992B|nr:LysR substrate-binding domain-containing protein [Bordetella bronchiseptica]